MATANAAKPAQPQMWEELEEHLSAFRDRHEFMTTDEYAAYQFGLEDAFEMLRETLPFLATCQASPKMLELLEGFVASGVSHDGPTCTYVEMQVDRDTLREARKLIAKVKG